MHGVRGEDKPVTDRKVYSLCLHVHFSPSRVYKDPMQVQTSKICQDSKSCVRMSSKEQERGRKMCYSAIITKAFKGNMSFDVMPKHT